ncbi:MAG: fibronectin type III domain-containing protein [Limnochordaceae bacterium]|nr:fibronectin type III domain-containing protein [Limnochordaceae bacterium]
MVALAGCGVRRLPSPGAAGQVQVQVVAQAMVQPGSGETVVAVLQKDGLELRTTLAPDPGGTGWAGSFASVPIGRWRLTVTLADGAGAARYVGSTDVEVDANQTSMAQVRLQPAPTQIRIQVDLAGFPARERVRMIAVRTYPSVGTSTKILPSESGRYEVTLSVPPRTYDMSLELYEGENLSDPLLYATPWRQVKAESGTSMTLVWTLDGGGVHVGGQVDDSPPAPVRLTAQMIPAGVELAWQIPENAAADAREYIIYRRRDRFGPYDEVGRAEGSSRTFIYRPSSSDRGRTLWFAVSAWDGFNESVRSPEVEVLVANETKAN